MFFFDQVVAGFCIIGAVVAIILSVQHRRHRASLCFAALGVIVAIPVARVFGRGADVPQAAITPPPPADSGFTGEIARSAQLFAITVIPTEWQKLAVEVHAGDDWEFAARGALQCDPNTKGARMSNWVSPQGVHGEQPTDLADPTGFPLSSAQTCSFIFKFISRNGTQIYPIGDYMTIHFDVAGEIFAGVNDRLGYWGDNNGHLIVIARKL